MKFLLMFLALSSFSYAGSDSICGEDERVSRKDQKIGRLTYNFGTACTITMIGKECAISAGHCIYFMYDGKVEFNVPMSKGETLGSADPKNVYKVDAETIEYVDGGYGRDWSVFRILPNDITKSYPGDVNGFYKVNFSPMNVGEQIMISGYGMDQRVGVNTHGTLQVAYGKILEIDEYTSDGIPAIMMSHDVDTTRGDSGAAIIRVKEQDIIGVHTHGGFCGEVDGNKGTPMSEAKKFKEAITNCLETVKSSSIE